MQFQSACFHGSAVPDYLSVAAPLVIVCDVINAWDVCEGLEQDMGKSFRVGLLLFI